MDEQSITQTLRGWDNIRHALQFVESLGAFSKHTLAGVEVYQNSVISKSRVFVRTIDELDSYLAPILERLELDIESGFITPSMGLDVLAEVYGKIVLDYPYDTSSPTLI